MDSYLKIFFSKKGLLLVFFVFFMITPLIFSQFYTRLFTRILIYGIVALSLDLLVGYTGLVSFGHAAFLGIGAYIVGICSFHGFESAMFTWPLAVIVSALIAAFIGLISLRTKGMYFIMITMAFAQMFYYLFSSFGKYGGDDGFGMWSRNSLGVVDISEHSIFYYVVFLSFTLIFILAHFLVKSKFGRVLHGIKQNEEKMISLGYPVFRYKLVCFVIAGGIAGFAGVLLANHELYLSPALLHWTRSGDLLVMVILGGLGSLIGPVIGAFALLLTEEILSGYTKHWMIILGPLLLLVVLYGKKGIYGFVKKEH
jgi:branched-chain amino acid transport system permease protein